MRFTKTLTCFLTLLILSTPSWAQGDRPQRGRGGPGMGMGQAMDPEKAQVVWTWQANDVARDLLKLDEAQTGQLADAYAKSRARLTKAVQSMRPQGGGAGEAAGDGAGRGRGDGGARMQMYMQIIEEERAGLESKLGEFLTDEQVTVAMGPLGTYNGQWDRMTDVIVGFELGDDATYAALVPVRNYLTEFNALRESGDRQGMREGMQTLRESLMTDLEPVLSEEQLEEFGEMTMRRRGRGGGDRQRGGGRGGAAGGDDPVASGATIGEVAPAFTLTDSDGNAHALSDYAGKIVVLQWINPDCPICRRVSESGRVTAMRTEIIEIDDSVVHLTINSTHYMEPQVGADYLKGHGIDAPVLIDKDGTVGRLYVAKTTPHMYVIDAEGVLRYQGAIDDDQAGRKGDEATNYVVNAVRMIKAGETVSPDSTRPYGCSVKYAK